MHQRRARSLGAALVLAMALLSAAVAQMSIEASPLRVEVQAAPGGSNTQAITLTNVGSQTVRVRASLSDWYLSRDGAPQFEESVPRSSVRGQLVGPVRSARARNRRWQSSDGSIHGHRPGKHRARGLPHRDPVRFHAGGP